MHHINTMSYHCFIHPCVSILGSLILFDLLVHQRDPASKADNSNNDIDVAAGNSSHSNIPTAVSDSALPPQPSEAAGQVEVCLPSSLVFSATTLVQYWAEGPCSVRLFQNHFIKN